MTTSRILLACLCAAMLAGPAAGQMIGSLHTHTVVAADTLVDLALANDLGYGETLRLDLVYNPAGAFLPARQAELEADYKRELSDTYGVAFTSLRALANMPIGRFRESLGPRAAAGYLRTLRSSFNGATLPGLMCRRQVSVGWDGTLYDCDFNLALRLPISYGAPGHIRDFDAAALSVRRIVTGEHCFGCTAGPGSSCGGALAPTPA